MHMRKPNILTNDRGQILVIFALSISMLLLFTGLAIDTGLLYVTKSKLSAAVDGACLAGMKSLAQGQTTATSVATHIFNANYGSNPPVPGVTFPTDASGNQQVKVTATVNVHTLFMQLLTPFTTVPVSDTAVATRGKLIMTIVLDRSGSMGNDGGMAGLQAAVPSFVNDFDQTPNTGDEVGMVSFSSNSTIDYAINYSFKTPINNDISSMTPNGGTFGTGAGTGTLLSNTIGPPLSLAGLMNDGVTIPVGQNVVKVVVYFTDGLMNTIQDNFHCGGVGNATLTLLNYGGHDASQGTNNVAIQDPTAPNTTFYDYAPGGTYFEYNSASAKCKDSTGAYVTTFPSQQTGLQTALSRTNVTAEAKYRANKTATALRSEASHPNYIYTIGLGSGVDSPTQMLLKEIANDPTADTYDNTQTTGEFFLIADCPSTPSSTCTNHVLQVFQTIAAKVLLRLTQ